MARSIFNAVLRIDELRLPVKLYSAVESRAPGFRLLHASDRRPVRQRMVHPLTGEEIPHEATRKGVELPGAMVVLRDEELAAVEPAPTREIQLLRFIDVDSLDDRWYLRPYFLGPDGDPHDYFALARALAAERKQGIVRWTMRKKSYRGALLAHAEHLALLSLHAAEELVALTSLPEQAWPSLSPAELDMAGQLIAMLEQDFHAEQFHDRHAEQIAALIQAKTRGYAPTRPAPTPIRAPERTLTDVLAASIARLEEQRVA